MNYSILTEQMIIERYARLPEAVQRFLDSDDSGDIVRTVVGAHFLPPEKAEIFEQLVGLVLLGFVPTDQLAQELQEHAFVNAVHARAIAEETIDTLRPMVPDLPVLFKLFGGAIRETPQEKQPPGDASIPVVKGGFTVPAATQQTTGEDGEIPIKIERRVSSIAVTPKEVEQKDGAVSISTQRSGEAKPAEKDSPFVLFEAAPAAPATKQRVSKSFAVPFGFFNKSGTAATTPPPLRTETPVKASIEAGGPSTESEKKGSGIIGKIMRNEPKRVVHYGEFRTPISPLRTATPDDTNIFKKVEASDVKEGIVQITKPFPAQNSGEPPPASTQGSDEAKRKSPFGFPTSSGPRVDGNTVQLN